MGKKGKKGLDTYEVMTETFLMTEADGNGKISIDEFVKVMSEVGIDPATSEKVFNRYDQDKSGELDKDEFYSYILKGVGDIKSIIKEGPNGGEDKIKEAFRLWDQDGNGKIEKVELERVLAHLNPTFTKQDITAIIKQADKNKDGVIDYEEFIEWLYPHNKQNKKK
eukprot:gnl/MRDRNA2_/MRDRNA2_118473_c0_seq1.p1 gnl/MRDRNA2_/MRDRNA2_118473_c0~~gnl/MRDRNA2_/MRDRNA2_118473_c0_seq1.p1  ORF type:complete len:166 (-),score=49.55 gnl/MRDRNA2_/MRDRNA2_118473_c0_seq1:2-499(-)